MNQSGAAVKSLFTTYELSPQDLWLVNDDIDLPLGIIRVQHARSSAGHKGVQDVINKIGSQEFYRFRIGVRPERVPSKRSREWMNDFVTKKVRGTNKEKLEEATHLCTTLITEALEKQSPEDVLGDHKIE